MPTLLWIGDKPRHDQILDLPNEIRKGLIVSDETSNPDYIVFSGQVEPNKIVDAVKRFPDVKVMVPVSDRNGHQRWRFM